MRVAGIVVYNPDIDRLRLNIQATIQQVDCLIIYQNSLFDLSLIEEYKKVVLLNNGVNKGIGTALNCIMAYAKKQEAEWCLLLDQDSVISVGYVDNLEKHSSLERAGIITPFVVDEHEQNTTVIMSDNNNTSIIDMCITSGSYNNISIWESIGGFREEFFIDYIDWEYCARLRNAGYRVYKIDSLIIHHELGTRSYHKLFHKSIYTFNHNAFRKYYITRNTIVTYKLYPHEKKLKHPYLRAIKRWLITIIFEKDKTKKTIAIAKGIIDSRALYHEVRRKHKNEYNAV